MSPFGSWCATACFGFLGDEVDQPLQPARPSCSRRIYRRLPSGWTPTLRPRVNPPGSDSVGYFVLVCCLKSVAQCSGRHPGRGDFLSMIEEAMSIKPIIFVLVILLFGFDLTGHVEIPRRPQ